MEKDRLRLLVKLANGGKKIVIAVASRPIKKDLLNDGISGIMAAAALLEESKYLETEKIDKLIENKIEQWMN